MAKDQQGKSQRDLIADISTHEKDPLLHLTTVGRCIGRDGRTIGRWIDEGLLKAVRVGKLYKVRKSEVARILQNSVYADDPEVMKRITNLTGNE